MSDQLEPVFDDRFWDSVSERVEIVRGLTRHELARAEDRLLAVEESAEVVPVFPAPFWNRVGKRAAKVRQMALDELSDAEDSLLRQGDGEGRHRARVPALPRLSLPLKTRFNTLGFATAVLAVLLLMPQVVPISSFADVRQRGPLAFFFSDDSNAAPEPAGRKAASSDPGSAGGGESSRTGTASSSSERALGTGSNGAAFTSPASGKAGSSGSTGDSTPSPGGSSATGTGGGTGDSGAGSSSLSAGDGAAGVSTEDGASALSVPDSPSNVLVTAVDDRTVRIRWKDNSPDESRFAIERRGQTAVGRQTVDANTKSYLWSGLLPGTEFCFRVRAENAAGTSSWVPEPYRCVTTHAAPATALPVALAPVSCASEASLAAGAALQETQITFRNLTAAPVRIYALNRNGVREPSPVSLAPQASTTIDTFIGTPFVVTGSDEAASCLAIFSGESWSSAATIS